MGNERKMAAFNTDSRKGHLRDIAKKIIRELRSTTDFPHAKRKGIQNGRPAQLNQTARTHQYRERAALSIGIRTAAESETTPQTHAPHILCFRKEAAQLSELCVRAA
jgi:hypothetical protein